MDLDYRRLEESDIGSYYDVRLSATENFVYPHQVHYLARNLVIEEIRQNEGWLCEVDGVVVGVCLPRFCEKPIIAALFVRPGWHGNGIGRELLSRATGWLEKQGCREVSLITDPGSRADGFYQHLGWIRGGIDRYGCQVNFTKRLG